MNPHILNQPNDLVAIRRLNAKNQNPKEKTF